MKKIISLSITACFLLFFSCSKNENTPSEEEQYYDVSFNVSLYTTNIRPMNTEDGDSDFEDAGIRKVSYYIYNINTGKSVHSKNYPTFEDDNLPKTITFRVTKGSYRIVVAAAGALPSHQVYDGFMYGSGNIFSSSCGLTFDTFIGYQDFIVDENSIDNANISLRRVTGRLDFISSETIPEDVTSLFFTFSNVPKSLYISSYTLGPEYDAIIGASVSISSENYKNNSSTFSFYIFGMPENEFITLKSIVGRGIDGIIFEKEINVPINVYTNKITELTGPLLDDESVEGGATITISNPTWDEDKITKTFD